MEQTAELSPEASPTVIPAGSPTRSPTENPTANPASSPARRAARATKSQSAQGSLFRVVWRWHFYAGVIVSPVLVLLAATGALYIFKAEIEQSLHADRMFVEPQAQRLTLEAQLDAATDAYSHLRPTSVVVPAEENRSTAISFKAADGAGDEQAKLSRTVFVDPYTGAVLGDLETKNPAATFFSSVLSLHRDLFMGATGRVVTELCTGWTLILLVTGIYLWWPRRGSKSAGVWWPRLRAKPYTVLRDLHTIGGLYLLPIAVIIVVTGIFYTVVVGSAIVAGSEYITHKPAEVAAEETSGDPPKTQQTHASETAREFASSGRQLAIDQLAAIVHRRYPERILYVPIAAPGEAGDRIRIGASNDYNSSYGPYVSAQVTLSRADGSTLDVEHLADGKYFWHGWAYPLHVGSVFGPLSKVLWLLACGILIALPITGLWMWWQRRPAGSAGLPRRPATTLPRWMVVVIAAHFLALPLVGISILVIWLGEQLVGRVRMTGGFQ